MELKNLENKQEIVKLFYLYGEDLYENTEKNDKLLQKILKKEERLFDSLTEEQKEQFNEINDLRAKDFEESDKNISVFAFTLAVRLIMECLNKEN